MTPRKGILFSSVLLLPEFLVKLRGLETKTQCASAGTSSIYVNWCVKSGLCSVKVRKSLPKKTPTYRTENCMCVARFEGIYSIKITYCKNWLYSPSKTLIARINGSLVHHCVYYVLSQCVTRAANYWAHWSNVDILTSPRQPQLATAKMSANQVVNPGM